MKRVNQCKCVSQCVNRTRCLCKCVQRESRVVGNSRRVTEGVSLSLWNLAGLA